jgi:hypothetical protein
MFRPSLEVEYTFNNSLSTQAEALNASTNLLGGLAEAPASI